MARSAPSPHPAVQLSQLAATAAEQAERAMLLYCAPLRGPLTNDHLVDLLTDLAHLAALKDWDFAEACRDAEANRASEAH